MTKIKVGINGFGRIGRNVFRTINENFRDQIEVVAINDPSSSTQASAHLIKYDSVLGRYKGSIEASEDSITVDGFKSKILKDYNPANLDWAAAGVDIVLECTGVYTDAEKAKIHLESGAKKVLISAPGKNEDITIVVGVNEEDYKPEEHHIISNASCTTNCLAPVTKVLDDAFSIENGLMTTIHSYTSDQRLLDNSHRDPRRARAAGQSMIPTSTGAAKAIALVLPHLAGKLNGFAIRVPTPNVSVTDVVFTFKNPISKESINKVLKEASEGKSKGIIEYTEEPLVSIDFVSNPHSAIIDASMTTVIGDKQAKILCWYDNEYGYSNRLCDLAVQVGSKLPVTA